MRSLIDSLERDPDLSLGQFKLYMLAQDVITRHFLK